MKQDNNKTAPLQLTEQSWDDHAVPIVSVFNWVYNHKDFIHESIESILIQKTNFPVEIIIHDDASNDGTREIILEYETKYPKLFRNILQSENQYSQGKSVMIPLFEKPKGKYIALTHGDDYWTDPLKLQKQVDYLEDNSEYVMSFHSVKVENQIKNLDYQYKTPSKSTLTLKDLVFKHYIPTCSLVFKREAMPMPLPEWFHKCAMGDIPLELLLASKGLTKYFNESMAVYRKHANSITSNKSQIKNGRKGYVYMYKEIRKFLGIRYWVIFSIIIIKYRLGYIKDWVGLKPLLRSEN